MDAGDGFKRKDAEDRKKQKLNTHCLTKHGSLTAITVFLPWISNESDESNFTGIFLQHNAIRSPARPALFSGRVRVAIDHRDAEPKHEVLLKRFSTYRPGRKPKLINRRANIRMSQPV